MEAVGDDIQIDLTSVDAWGGGEGPKIAPGEYIFSVEHVEQKNARSSGQPGLVVTFKVASEGEENGKTVKKTYSLQPQSLPRLKQLCMACRASLDRIRPSELVGSLIVAQLVHREVRGQPDQNGNVAAPRPMMDIINEQPYEEEQPAPAAAQPPRAAVAQPPPNGSRPTARRATVPGKA